MEKTRIRLGYCPTRREVFSREEAIRFSGLIKDIISRYDIDIVDLEGINEDQLLFQYKDLDAIEKRFRDFGVDAVFFPHCNFGSESLVSQIARRMNVPVLLWGPRDDAPLANGMRTRDTQCGLFATGKVLRRHKVPFTYLTNSWYCSEDFTRGFEKFLRVASVVKSMKHLKILQISTRPEPFSTVICNEGELLEKFDVHVHPVTLTALTVKMQEMRESAETIECAKYIKDNISPNSADDAVLKMASMKTAIKELCKENYCRAAAIQCWNDLQDMTGIMPCLANALLADEGLPVACETDICGAISAVMLQAAAFDEKPHFFADVTIRDAEDDNKELLWHCGVFPYSLAKNKDIAFAGEHWILPSKAYGTCSWEIKGGDVTIIRFDGDNGEYKLLIGEAEGCDGPMTGGSYLWIKVKDWPMWEHKLVEGPYIHHVAGIHGKYAEVLMEACKYINNLSPDLVEPSECELKKRWY